MGGKEYEPGDVLESCTIITTRPNVLMAKIHDRMPVILDPKHYDAWLDPRFQDEEKLNGFLAPCPATKLKCWPVSNAVNKVEGDDSENCIKEVKV
jgi:putative SOS response-associated peptidase YedK